MLRSAGAVIAGFVFIGALSFGADAILRALVPGAYDAAGRATSVPILLAIQAYVAVFAVSGCYLTARIAGRRPMLHALVLGALGLVFNVAGAIALWDTAPAWYHILSLVLVMPYAWLGGWIRVRQLAGTDAEEQPLAAFAPLVGTVARRRSRENR